MVNGLALRHAICSVLGWPNRESRLFDADFAGQFAAYQQRTDRPLLVFAITPE
jgi:hypothetical protein